MWKSALFALSLVSFALFILLLVRGPGQARKAPTPVNENEFEISDGGIKHLPTGYEFNPHPGRPFSGYTHLGAFGHKSRRAERYVITEIEQAMHRLWAEYVKKRGL